MTEPLNPPRPNREGSNGHRTTGRPECPARRGPCRRRRGQRPPSPHYLCRAAADRPRLAAPQAGRDQLMTPERDRRIYEVFQTVRGCDPAGRSTLLDQLCGGDPELRAEVESLLAQDAEAEQASFLAPLTPPGASEQGP